MAEGKTQVPTPSPEGKPSPTAGGLGEGAGAAALAGGAPIEFEAPCCGSVRECYERAHYVISLTKLRVLRRIDALRCYRGIRKKYRFYPSEDVALISHYVSNRGVNYITILWKPNSVNIERVIEAARKALGLETTSKLVVRGAEVVEEVVEDG
jgi:hypothetical protein